LRFIYDYDTNSILVANASPGQLATVERLIKIYDRAPSEDSLSARRFKIFQLTYAQAENVATTIKEVYRDLLSSKDKEFQGKNDEKQSNQTTNYYRVYGSSEDGDKKPTKVKASFAGALSVGVNQAANTVIVSAQEEWMSSIAEMIAYLDRNAETATVVHQVDGRISSSSLKTALAILGRPQANAAPKQPAKGGNEQKPPAENGKPNGEGNP
jgi:type II secretory pathway component GspD/PulD (secretin)